MQRLLKTFYGRWGFGFAWMVMLLLVSVEVCFSDEVGRGGYAGSFLRMGLGARAMGMGGGSVALVDDGYAVYYNPAGLVFLENRWFTTTINSMALDRRLFYVGYAQSIGGREEDRGVKGLLWGGFAVGWLCTGVDRIDARDFSGNDIGTLSNWENCFYFSFALNPAPPLSVGLSGKLLYNRFPDITDKGESLSAVGFGFDIGLILRPFHFLTLGLTVRDIRSRYTWDTQKLWLEQGSQRVDTFPHIIRGGLAWRMFQNRLTVSLDLEKVEYWPVTCVVGIQVEGYRGTFLRGGVRDGDVSYGLGYRMSMLGKFIQLDYGFVPDPVAPRGSHVFTWSFLF